MINATTVNSGDLARLVLRARDGLVRHLESARQGDVRGVHQARVASRRLRELLPVVEVALDRRLPGVRRDVRRITRALGPVRELDVTRAVLADLWKKHDWPAPALGRVDGACERARAVRRDDMEGRLSRGGAADLPRQLTALAAAIETSAEGRRAGTVLASRLRQRVRTMLDALDHVGVVYVPDALHAVRIAGKKLRYTLEIGQGTAGLPVAVSLKELKAVQELLGGLHDRQVVQGWMQSVAAESGSGRPFMRALSECEQVIEADCRRRHARFLKRLPRLRPLIETVGRDAVLGLLTSRPSRMRDASRSAPTGGGADEAMES